MHNLYYPQFDALLYRLFYTYYAHDAFFADFNNTRKIIFVYIIVGNEFINCD